ncbi:MAG: phytoene desaturase [Phycisphaerales bacterium]|nr:phytoene desaturase [Phycisphaerales bacterium]
MVKTADGVVAVVGAGPGGLAAAMLLAASGLRVKVYEALPEIGGRTGREAAVDREGRRFLFDRGPTFFLMPYVLEEIFAAAGRRLSDYAELRRLDPMYRLIVGQPGREPITLDATQDVPEMCRRIGAVDPGDGAAFARFIADNRTKLRLMEPILRRPIRSVLDLLSLDTMKVGPLLKPHLSVHQLLRKYFRHPAVQLAVSFQSKYLGMSPYECPSLFTILPFIEYEYGIWHPIGGCHALMLGMADACREMGVEFVTSAPVERIVFEGRRAVGVEIASGPHAGRHAHGHVVVNADATWALKKFIPQALRGADTDAALDAKKYSCSTYMLYAGIEGEIGLPHHTIYISERYRENLDNISRDGGAGGRLSDDPSVYLCNPSPIDGTLAPRGCSSAYVLVPTPNTRAPIDWDAARGALREQAIEQIERRLGVKDFGRRIVAERVITPADWRNANINYGATFNLAHNLGQMLHRRPQHRLPGVDGVWLVGGGTHPGSGLPVIFLSSQITARLLCNELGAAYAPERLGSIEPKPRRPLAAVGEDNR